MATGWGGWTDDPGHRRLVPDPAARETLHDLEVTCNMVYEREGADREADVLLKSVVNRQRRWMDDRV